MKTTILASRVTVPSTDYTVLLRTSGAGNVDISVWLTDEEALLLASQLRSAVASTPATPTEAA